VNALESYQDAGRKAGALRFVPTGMQIRLGPAVQRVAASALHVCTGGRHFPRFAAKRIPPHLLVTCAKDSGEQSS
jgi:hypothetical protein